MSPNGAIAESWIGTLRRPLACGAVLLIALATSVPTAVADNGLNADKDGLLDPGGDGIANPGDLINYTINVSLVPTECQYFDIVLTDPLLGMIVCPTSGDNTIPNLPLPGPVWSETCTGSYAITQPDIDLGSVVNVVDVQYLDCSESPGSTGDRHTVFIEQVGAIDLEKSGDVNPGGDGVATPGDLIEYDLVVTNTGNITLVDAAVSDPKLAGLTCPGGNPISFLAPGDAVTCTGSYAITQADIDAKVVMNTAAVMAYPGGGQPPPVPAEEIAIEDEDTLAVDIPWVLALGFTKTGALDTGPDGESTPGDLIHYTFEIANNSNFTIFDLEIKDPDLPMVGCPGGHPISELAPGGSETCTAKYSITEGDIEAGVKDNTAVLDAFDPREDLITETDSHSEPIPVGAIELVKQGDLDVGGDGVATVGDLINYSLVVTNVGTAVLTDVTLTDTVLASFDCPGGHPIALLGLAESVTCSGSYAITQADIDAGEKVNTATVEASEGGPQQGANRASAQSMVQVMIPQQPTILLVKTGTADLGPDGVADPGDTIDYELVVANEGNVTLTNVAISDPMLPVLTCPSGNPIPTMAPGATETCSGTYTITAADIDAGVVNNNAEASGQDPMTQTVVAGATATMDLAPMAPSLGVWGLIALALVLAAAGALTLRRRDVTA